MTCVCSGGSPGNQKRFCIWKSLLVKDLGAGRRHASLSAMELKAELQRLHSRPGIFVVILLRGGHFAASVFRSQHRRYRQQQGKGDEDPEGASSAAALQQQDVDGGEAGGGPATQQQGSDADFEVLVHKTLHRYVVR